MGTNRLSPTHAERSRLHATMREIESERKELGYLGPEPRALAPLHGVPRIHAVRGSSWERVRADPAKRAVLLARASAPSSGQAPTSGRRLLCAAPAMCWCRELLRRSRQRLI